MAVHYFDYKSYIFNVGNVSKMHQKDVFINAVCLPLVDTVKDLGILIVSQLKLDLHINSIVAKAHARTCIIFRCFVSKDRHSLIKAFITYVRPLVEYASCVWSPSNVGLIRKTRRSRNALLKDFRVWICLIITSGLLYLALKVFNLGDLKLIFVWLIKKTFNLVAFNVDNLFAVRTNKIKRGHPYTLVKPLYKVRARSNFFACSVVDPWNYLDAKSNSFKLLNAFKNFLGVCDLSNFLSISNSHNGVFIFYQCLLIFFFLILYICI